MSPFSPVVEKDLLACGWYLGRRVDTEPYRQSAQTNNLPYHEAADAFLREFGGLAIWTKEYSEGAGNDTIWLDPAEIVAFTDKDDPKRSFLHDLQDDLGVTSRQLNKVLTFIGNHGEFALYMADDGTVCGAYYGLMFVGENGSAALERLMIRGGPLQAL